MSIFQLALRNARAKSGRGIIVAIILTSMLISGVLNIGVCIQQSYLQTVIDEYGDAHAKFSNLTMDQINFLKNRIELDAYILAVAPNGSMRPAPDSPIAIPFQSVSPLMNDPSLKLASGRAPATEDEIALFPHTAELLGISPAVGDRLDLFLTDRGVEPQPYSFVISGILEEKAAWGAQNIQNIVVSEAFALKHARLPVVYSPDTDGVDDAALSVRYRDGYDPYDTTEQLAELAGITNAVKDARLNKSYLAAKMQSPQTLIPIIAILSLFMLVGALVIYNIFNIQLIRRVRQTGLLSVIGATRKQIFKCVILEALMQALVALPIGLLLGAALTRVSVAGVLRMALPGATLVNSYSPAAFLAAALVTLGTVILSVLKPALRVASVAPVEAVRFSGASESKTHRRRFDEINLTRLSRINLWRNKGRTLVTILALTLCGALFIGVSTVGGSLLAGVETLARKGMAGDMQVTLLQRWAEPSESPLNAVFKADVAALDGVTAVHEIGCVSLSSQDHLDEDQAVIFDAEIMLFDEDLMRQQLDSLKDGNPDLASIVEPGNAIVVLGLDSEASIGDMVTRFLPVRSGNGEVSFIPVTLRIVGTVMYGDLRASSGDGGAGDVIMLPEALPAALVNEVEFNRLTIDVKPESHDAVASAVKQMCAGNESLYFQSLKDAIAQQRNSMVGMLMLLYAIIAVLGLVGFLNLANTTLVGIEQRRAELGVLSALGVDGNGLRKLLWGESRSIAVTCTAAAIAIGGALGYLGTLAMRNIGATYIRFTPPIWQSILFVALLFLIPFWITHHVSSKLSGEGAVSLLRVE